MAVFNLITFITNEKVTVVDAEITPLQYHDLKIYIYIYLKKKEVYKYTFILFAYQMPSMLLPMLLIYQDILYICTYI